MSALTFCRNLTPTSVKSFVMGLNVHDILNAKVVVNGEDFYILLVAYLLIFLIVLCIVNRCCLTHGFYQAIRSAAKKEGIVLDQGCGCCRRKVEARELPDLEEELLLHKVAFRELSDVERGLMSKKFDV